MNHTHDVLAFYHLTAIDDPHEEVRLQRLFCSQYDIKGRVYISAEGINAQMSGSCEASRIYMDWMKSRSLYNDVIFKIHPSQEHAFPRLTIKYRAHLVGHDEPIDLSLRGQHLSPAGWKERYEKNLTPVVLDIRNDYEWEVGRFQGAECPPCETFRDFETYANELKEKIDPENTPVMMYCTGGIRCELFSALLIQKGFKEVYQLDGGVIGYGLNEGSKYWDGKLFVFDDRLTVPISDEPTKIISCCSLCQQPSDVYYNCANIDCNKLFIACANCMRTTKGCCTSICLEKGTRLRPYNEATVHKPFKRAHTYLTSNSP